MTCGTSGWRRACVVVTLLGAGSLGAAAPAAAHPFGPPLTTTVAAEGDAVTVRWVAAEDDWVVLGDHLGVFGDPAGDTSGPGSGQPRTGAEILATSGAVEDYLLERIEVGAVRRPGGVTACPGRITQMSAETLAEGVELRFRCPDLGGGFEVTVRTLMDVHDAYRVAVTGVGTTPRRALLTRADPTAGFTRGRAGGMGPVVPAFVAVGVMVVGWVALVRRRRVDALEGTT